MPDPVIEPPPAEPKVAVAPPPGADPQPDTVPENVKKLLSNLHLDEPEVSDEKPKPGEPKEPKEAPTAADPKAPKDPKAPAADPAAPPADPSIKLRKPKVVRPELPIAAAPAPAAAAPKDEPYKPDPQWESGLDETGKEMLADARFMEERFPDKYKGWTARTAKFLRDHADLTSKDTFDANAPEYKSWLDKNQPRLTREQIREVEEVRVADRVGKQWQGRYDDLQHKMFVKEHEPKIETEGRTLFAELSQTALPEDLAAAIKKDGYDKANEVYALELQTAQNVLTVATQDLMEFRRITLKDPETGRQLQPVVEDPNHPKFAQHQRLSQLVAFVCDEFKNKAAAEQQQKNGKWFVTRDEWNAIRPDQRHRFWTFTNQELIGEAKKNVKTAVQMAIDQQRGQMKKLGWQPPAPKAPPAAPPPKNDPPQPTNTPRIPAAVPTPGSSDVLADVDARAKRLATTLGRE